MKATLPDHLPIADDPAPLGAASKIEDDEATRYHIIPTDEPCGSTLCLNEMFWFMSGQTPRVQSYTAKACLISDSFGLEDRQHGP